MKEIQFNETMLKKTYSYQTRRDVLILVSIGAALVILLTVAIAFALYNTAGGYIDRYTPMIGEEVDRYDSEFANQWYSLDISGDRSYEKLVEAERDRQGNCITVSIVISGICLAVVGIVAYIFIRFKSNPDDYYLYGATLENPEIYATGGGRYNYGHLQLECDIVFTDLCGNEIRKRKGFPIYDRVKDMSHFEGIEIRLIYDSVRDRMHILSNVSELLNGQPESDRFFIE